MKIVILGCHECEKAGAPRTYRALPVRNDNIYNFVCNEGHETVYTEQIYKFEQLFEIGCNAIADGYYREAILSFAASLERFYETFLQTLAYYNFKSLDQHAVVWKRMKMQSERQSGAFQIAYLYHFRKVCSDIDNTKIVIKNKKPKPTEKTVKELRNDVAHQGFIPTELHALNFGSAVMKFIKPIVLELRNLYLEGGGPGLSSDVFSIIKIIETHSTMDVADKMYPSATTRSTGGSESALNEYFRSREPAPNLAALVEKRRAWRSAIK